MKEYKSKEWYYYKGKHIYMGITYFFKGKYKINCEGGESMVEVKELVFLEPEELPQKHRGGTNWIEIFNAIPSGKMLVMDEKTFGSAPNIRQQVAKYNKANGKVLTATQRTVEEKTLVYVVKKGE